MATYGFLDMFLGFSGFAFTAWGFVSLIFHWEALFQEVRDSCKGGIAHPKRSLLLWLVSLTIATWLLAAVTYSRDITAVWNLMKVSQNEDGGRGFAHVITQTYFFVLVICGGLGFIFTGWFLYHNRRDLPSLVMIIRFDAGKYHSVGDLENGRNARRERHTANITQALADLYQAPSSNNDGNALYLTSSSSGSDAQVNTRTTRPPTFDNWYATPDTESCSSCDSEYVRNIPCTRPAKHREPLTPTSPTAALAPFASDADADAENMDPHPKRRLDPNRRRGNGKYVREWAETEMPRLCQGHECRCAQVGAALQCKNSSEGVTGGIEGVSTRTKHFQPPREVLSERHERRALRAPIKGPKDTGARHNRIQTYGEILNELIEERSGANETARRDWEDAPGYEPGIEDNDDSEESDVSDSAVVRRPEGADSEAWNDGDRSGSYGLTTEQGIKTEREDTGPLNNVQGANEQATSAQEQRPWPTGTTFSPPGFPARHPRVASMLADERGHGQRPGSAEISRDIVRPLRITIPTQRLTYTEPRAPTTPANTHSLAEWPSRASGGSD